MNIIVCIKQVPDTASLHTLRINPKTNTLMRDTAPAIINPFDENAIEEGIRLREKYGGEVTVVSMGPSQVEKSLRDALAMGADNAILLSDRVFAGADTLATSYTLACAIKKIGKFDLVLFGKQAIDGDTAHVGPGVAEVLGLPQITLVRKIEIENGKLKAERTLEDSFELIETNLPAVVTVTKEINTPRYPSLKGIIKSKKTQITVWSMKEMELDPKRVGSNGSPTQVIRIFTPEMRSKGEILHGTSEDMVDTLIVKLRERKSL